MYIVPVSYQGLFDTKIIWFFFFTDGRNSSHQLATWHCEEKEILKKQTSGDVRGKWKEVQSRILEMEKIERIFKRGKSQKPKKISGVFMSCDMLKQCNKYFMVLLKCWIGCQVSNNWHLEGLLYLWHETIFNGFNTSNKRRAIYTYVVNLAYALRLPKDE